MKYTSFLLFSLFTLISCQKEDNADLTPPVVAETPERQISFSYLNTGGDRKVEIIVSDTAAHFLLDTLVSVDDMHLLEVRSEETKFNITTIDQDQSGNRKYVQTFYQVSPNQWKINQANTVGYFGGASHTGEVNGELVYYNLPQNMQELPQLGNAFSGGYNGLDKIITASYKSKLPYLSCLLFPSTKLYNFYEATTASDSVNAAQLHMDTALTLTFQKSTALSNNSARNVFIYRNKDDNSSLVRFWTSNEPGSTGYDIMYPSKGAEQYLVEFFGIDQNHKVHITRQLSDAIPATIDFLDSSYYSIVQNGIDLNISFPKLLPSVYTVSLTTNNLLWNINLPAEKNTFHLNDKMIDLSKSMRLNGFNFSQVQFGGLHLEKGDNMNYTDYYNFIFASDAPGKNKFHLYQYF
jgi:hypothetical protein